jgi:hypothetical protein
MALRELARTYLELQRRLWPEMVESGKLAEPTDDNVNALADDFKGWFLNQNRDEQLAGGPWIGTVAGCYIRYSDEGSNPRSLAQPLRLQLERARQNDHFIPWERVYGAAAITGTTADRHVYKMAKAAIADKEGGIAVLYIDGIGRASRGMDDAFRQGTNTGLPAIGYGLVPAVDPEGRQLFGKDGDPLNMLVVDRKMA